MHQVPSVRMRIISWMAGTSPAGTQAIALKERSLCLGRFVRRDCVMAHSIEARLDRSVAARTVEQATFMFDPLFRWFRGKQRREAYQRDDQDAKRNEQDFDGTHEILTLSNRCAPSSGGDGQMARFRQMDGD